MKNPLLIIIVIICAVLGISFYEAERRKESFENIPVIEGKVLEPSDLYREEKQNDSEALSNSKGNNNDENKLDIGDSIMKRKQNYSDRENEKESNDEERNLTCQYCGDKFTNGGTNHCDPNWSSKKDKNMSSMYEMREAILGGKKKYCSRKCACEAGED